MKIAVPKEIVPGENRVALVPDAAAKLVKAGFEVIVETGAGAGAHFDDKSYEDAGAGIVSTSEAFGSADVVFKVQKPVLSSGEGVDEVAALREGATLISFLQPAGEEELLGKMAERNISFLSMNTLPRISRAQSMDALSSQASLAGYKAVLLAAAASGKFFPMMTTAAGTMPPAKVFILGAGVAGLQAIATARRLGAVVEAFDIRPAVKEEVQSLGARFVELALNTGEEEGSGSGAYAKEMSEEHRKAEQEMIAGQPPGGRARPARSLADHNRNDRGDGERVGHRRPGRRRGRKLRTHRAGRGCECRRCSGLGTAQRTEFRSRAREPDVFEKYFDPL